MARSMQRRFVESIVAKIDIRATMRARGAGAFAGEGVELKSPAGLHWVHLARSSRRCGGQQVYFLCERCERRTCFLYLVGRALACRACHRLSYWTEAITPAQRRVRRLMRIRERMGQHASRSVVDPLPAKRKWMRWRTYDRLRGDLAHIEALHFSRPLSARLLRRIGVAR